MRKWVNAFVAAVILVTLFSMPFWVPMLKSKVERVMTGVMAPLSVK